MDSSSSCDWMEFADEREDRYCSICLGIYTHPVMLSCGHNFCQDCIQDEFDTQEEYEDYSCPECGKTFHVRPALQKNLKLCNIVERFLSTEPEEEDGFVIFCTYCDSSVPAAKTCLLCDDSLCDIHLKEHSKSEEHVLVEPNSSVETRKCPIHKKLMKYYCNEDAACVCVSCFLIGEHRGHQVELLKELLEKKNLDLRQYVEELTSERDDIKKIVQSLRKHRRKVQEKAAGVTDRVTALFRDIRAQLEVLEKRVLSEITRQEEQVSLRVSDLIQQLEIKRDELSREMHDIEQTCNEADAEGYELDFTDFVEEHEDRESDFKKAPSVRDFDEVLISLTLHRLADIVTDLKAKRQFYVQEASDILLDENTAANNVSVSDDLKTASCSETDQLLPDTAERFLYFQVLSTRSFSSGRHYWEVETSESGYWRLGMSYPSIDRKQDQCWFGYNNKSWCLCMYDTNNSMIHGSKRKRIYPESPLQRVGIYLDYEAGRLSFYQLCDPIRHLHTFTATFTEPLHAAFYVYNNGWVRIRS
ncbi:hypothetical protein FKM82_002726 [Ascaphus truei]